MAKSIKKIVKLAEKIHPKKPSLKRALGVFHLTLAGVGLIVGAGIYVLIGEAAGIAGNAMWISFFIAAFVSALTALSYAELSSLFPRSGGEFLYVKNSFGISTAIVILFFILFEGILSVSAVSLGFASYFSSFFSAKIPLFVFSFIAIFFFALIAMKGIRESSWINVVLTFIEVGGLVFVILIGLPQITSGVNFLETPALATNFSIFSAAAIIFFAFQGIGGLVKFSDEAKNPKKDVPIAIILTVIITTLLYILVGFAAISTAGWEVLSTSKAPLSEIAKSVIGTKSFFVFTIIALVSTANTILLNLVANSRLLYDLSLESKKLKFFSKVNKKTRTPIRAVIFIALISLIVVFFGNLSRAAQLANFTLFFIFFFVNSSLIYLRFKGRTKDASFRIPLNIKNIPVTAVLGCITAIAMFFFLDIWVIVVGIISSAIIYGIYIGIYAEKRPKTLKKKFRKVVTSQPTISPKIPPEQYKRIRGKNKKKK